MQFFYIINHLIPVSISWGVGRKVKVYKCKYFLFTSFQTTLCTCYQIINSNLLLFENLGTIITQGLNQDQNINLSPITKGLKSLYCVRILGQRKKKKRKRKSKPNMKSIQRLGNTWNKSREKVEQKREMDLKKRLNILFHF